MITKANGKRSVPGLAKGQIWKLQQVYIQIVEVGSRLLHYRMLDVPGQGGVKVQTSDIDVIKGYLRSRHARLVGNGSAA